MIGRVVTAVLVRAGRLGDLLIDCWPAPEVTRARVLAKFADDVPAAGVAAGAGPGAVGAEPLAAPAPGQPHFKQYRMDRFVQADNKFQK